MKRKTYTIAAAIEAVADSLRGATDRSPTTIRCAINDHLDAMDKDGYRVNFSYDQPRAVKSVLRLIGGAR